jgi:hypothetical protein
LLPEAFVSWNGCGILEQDIIESCTFIEPHPIVHTWHRTGSGTRQSKSTEKREFH